MEEQEDSKDKNETKLPPSLERQAAAAATGSRGLQDLETTVETGEKNLLLAAKPCVVTCEVSCRFLRPSTRRRGGTPM